MRRASTITLVCMAAVVIGGVLYILTIDESTRQKRANTPAAKALLVDEGAVQYTDRKGEALTLDAYIGEYLVVTSWASWCPQCVDSLRSIGELSEQYQGKPVSFLAINRSEDKYTADRFLGTIAIPDTTTIILDSSDHFFSAVEGYAMPETLVFNERGEIVIHQRGTLNKEEIDRVLTEALP